MAEDKDIKDQIKKGLTNINQATKESVASIKQEDKTTSANIKQQAKETLSKFKEETKSVVEKATEKLNQSIDNKVERATDKLDKKVEQTNTKLDKKVEQTNTKIDEKVEQTNNKLDKKVDQAVDTLDKKTKKSSGDIEKVATGAIGAFKKLAEEQKKKLGEKAVTGPSTKSNDITTTLLQSILTEIKVLRKVTEGRVSFDLKSNRYRGAGGRYVKEGDVRESEGTAIKEKSEKEKKREGFFSSMKEKFAKGKQSVDKRLAPAKQGVRDVKEGASDLLSNPLVLAGLLALIAPKELLGFIKSFLGELLFGENANPFVQGLAAFVAVWAGMKFIKAISGFIRMVKGIFSVARFLFMNPMLLLAIALIASAVNFISDFRKKRNQREGLVGKEAELKDLEKQLSQTSDESQKKTIQEQINTKKKEIADLHKQGVYKTVGEARKAAMTGAMQPMPGGTEEAGKRALEFGIAKEKIKAGEALSKDEQQTYDSYKNEKDPFLSILKDFGPKQPTLEEINSFKQAVQNNVDVARGKKPTLEKTAPVTRDASQTDTSPSPDTRAAMAEQTDPSPPPTNATPSAAMVAANDLEKKKEDVARLEETTPSTGQDLNATSEAVDAEYDDVGEDSVTTVNADTSSIPKPSNVITSIPGIFADRSALSDFESFYTASPFPSAG